MARTQLLKEWAIDEFGEKDCPSYSALCLIAKNKMTSPPAFKVAGKWRLDKGARYVGPLVSYEVKTNNPIVQRVLEDGCKTKKA